jgi:hypothetical protein
VILFFITPKNTKRPPIFLLKCYQGEIGSAKIYEFKQLQSIQFSAAELVCGASVDYGVWGRENFKPLIAANGR